MGNTKQTGDTNVLGVDRVREDPVSLEKHDQMGRKPERTDLKREHKIINYIYTSNVLYVDK